MECAGKRGWWREGERDRRADKAQEQMNGRRWVD